MLCARLTLGGLLPLAALATPYFAPKQGICPDNYTMESLWGASPPCKVLCVSSQEDQKRDKFFTNFPEGRECFVCGLPGRCQSGQCLVPSGSYADNESGCSMTHLPSTEPFRPKSFHQDQDADDYQVAT